MLFFHILGISSSQLTNSYFSEGLAQPPTSNLWYSNLASIKLYDSWMGLLISGEIIITIIITPKLRAP